MTIPTSIQHIVWYEERENIYFAQIREFCIAKGIDIQCAKSFVSLKRKLERIDSSNILGFMVDISVPNDSSLSAFGLPEILTGVNGEEAGIVLIKHILLQREEYKSIPILVMSGRNKGREILDKKLGENHGIAFIEKFYDPDDSDPDDDPVWMIETRQWLQRRIKKKSS